MDADSDEMDLDGAEHRALPEYGHVERPDLPPLGLEAPSEDAS